MRAIRMFQQLTVDALSEAIRGRPAVWEYAQLFRGSAAYVLASYFEADSTFTKQLCRKAIRFSQHAQKQVSSTYELVRKLLCFVSGVYKDAPAFDAEGQIDGGRDSFPNYGVPFYLLTD